MKSYDILFQGYWREKDLKNIPAQSGIFIVYRSKYDPKVKAVGLREIIFIGEAENVNARLNSHEKFDQFKELLKPGEELSFAFAPVAKENLNIVENSMVFAQKPSLNDHSKDSYDYEEAEFKIDGQCIGLTYTEYTITN